MNKLERARARRERRRGRRKPVPVEAQVPGHAPVGRVFKHEGTPAIYQVQRDGSRRRVVVPGEAQA